MMSKINDSLDLNIINEEEFSKSRNVQPEIAESTAVILSRLKESALA